MFMVKNMLNVMLMSLSIMTMMFSNPIMKSVTIVIYTILTGILMMFYMENSWMSMILMISFMGGILILIIYVISTIENKPVTIKVEKNSIKLLLFMSMLTILIINKKNSIYPSQFKSNIFKMTELKFVISSYNMVMWKISIMMVLYLFFTMIAILKVISSKTVSMIN